VTTEGVRVALRREGLWQHGGLPGRADRSLNAPRRGLATCVARVAAMEAAIIGSSEYVRLARRAGLLLWASLAGPRRRDHGDQRTECSARAGARLSRALRRARGSDGGYLATCDASYGQGWGLLLTPVQISSSEFGSDLPGPVVWEPPFVLLLLPTGAPGNVHVEFGPAAVYVPPAAAQSCAGEAP